MISNPGIERNSVTKNRAQESFASPLFDVLRHELLYVLWALMDLSIATPLLLAVTPWARLWPVGVILLLLLLQMLVPFNMARLMNALKIDVDRQRVIMVIALIITILVTWRLLLFSPRPIGQISWLREFLEHIGSPDNPYRGREIALFLIVTIMWWRGLSLVGRNVDIDEIGFRMRLGVLLIFVLVSVMAAALLPWSVTPFVLLFFFSSLLAIVLTRVEQVTLGQSDSSFPISLRWLVVVVTASGLVAFITGILAGILSEESTLDVIGWFRPLFQALNTMLVVLLSVCLYLLSPLILLLSWLFGQLVGRLEPDLQEAISQLELLPQEGLNDLADDLLAPPDVSIEFPVQILSILVMFAVILIVSLALGRMVRNLRRNANSQRRVEGQLSGIGFTETPSLRQLLQRQFNMIRRWRTATSIRHLYRQMCKTAAEYGYPRAESETPYEYQQTLHSAWPENTIQVNLLTEAYIRVHYGEFPEDPDELTNLKAAWKTLESISIARQQNDDQQQIIQRR